MFDKKVLVAGAGKSGICASEHHNRVRVECVFAKTPSPEKENEIKAFLSRKYPGKELIYQISINPSLLGGVRIRIGNEEYDWTFAARIRQLKDAVGQI